MGKEPEIITFKEFFENNKNISFGELCKMVLVCKNCGHKDLLGKFIQEKNPDWKKWGEPILPQEDPLPYKPKPRPNPWNPYPKKYPRFIYKTKRLNMLWIDSKEYEDMFYCRKCGSSLVVLCDEFVKNNMLRGLEGNEANKE